MILGDWIDWKVIAKKCRQRIDLKLPPFSIFFLNLQK